MNEDDTFDHMVAEALDAPFSGWDFSYLDGRKTEISLPWDYAQVVRSRMTQADSMLDMGTGGGEFLSSLAPFPDQACATESYAPNVPLAQRRLEPLGVLVYDTRADQENRHLPFPDAEFDLVINRHECFVAGELHRILRPGGRFVSQQCGGYGEADLAEWFKGKGAVEPMDWTAAVASRQLEDAELRVVDAQEVYPEYSFLDVGAVVYDLRARPWLVEDFSVEKCRDRLLAIHRHIQNEGRLVVKDQRFIVEAVKPA